MASIGTRTTKDGKRRYVVYYRDDGGKQRNKAFPRKVEAKAFADEVEHSKRAGTYLDVNAGKVSFREHADRWVKNHYTDRRSREAITNKLTWYIYPQIGDRSLRSLVPSDVSGLFIDLKGQRGKPLAENTKQELFRIVSAILTGAVDDKLVPQNVARVRSVRRPKGSKHKVQPWTPERVRAVRQALPERYRIIVDLGVGLGLRQGEIFGLSVNDLEFDYANINRQVKCFSTGNKLTFDLPKYEKIRRSPLSPDLKLEIENYLDRFPARKVLLPWDEPDSGQEVSAPLIVTSREGRALNKNYFNNVWRKALEEAGVDLTELCDCCAQPAGRWQMMHVLRHTYASALLEQGENIVAIAENLGHADPSFTLRTYTHLMDHHDERTRTAITGFLKETR